MGAWVLIVMQLAVDVLGGGLHLHKPISSVYFGSKAECMSASVALSNEIKPGEDSLLVTKFACLKTGLKP